MKYPLSWINTIKAKSRPGRRWRVMLDAAAYVPTQPLDLSVVRPDFVSMSFYKIFGYPTGLGALLVRVDAAAELRKVGKFGGFGVLGVGFWRFALTNNGRQGSIVPPAPLRQGQHRPKKPHKKTNSSSGAAAAWRWPPRRTTSTF